MNRTSTALSLRVRSLLGSVGALLLMSLTASAADNTLHLNLRSRTAGGRGDFTEKTVAWEAKQTALIL